MTDDYLWDRSGTPDPEIQRLESALAKFRHTNRSGFPVPLAVPEEKPVIPSEARNLSSISASHLPAETFASVKPRVLLHLPSPPRLAAAAVVLLAFAAGLFYSMRPSIPQPSGPSWTVANLEGTPQIGPHSISSTNLAAKLYVGQTLTTNSFSRATLSDNDLGQIQVDPNSRVRLLQTGPDHKRLQLDVGTIHAAIWAPPGQFVVDTPSAVAVDLGCAYTLQVSPDGSGTIRTALGWVGFHLNGRDSFIPAGAMCSTRPKVGPGTPYFEDASPSFREALHSFDQSDPSSDAASAALETVLAQARPRDALTLWHLLSRTTGLAREKVFSRLATLVPLPPNVTRQGILQLDSHMLDLYWNALDLGDISLWRLFEQNAAPNFSPASSLPVVKKQLLLKQSP